jgi:acetate kinase
VARLLTRVLTVNAGSSSLKLSVLEGDDLVVERSVPADGGEAALRAVLADAGDVSAVGHRIVHGGEEFRAATLVDERVRAQLEALTDLAPLHQPKSLRALDLVTAALPGVPAVACFDTAFHATIPEAASTYALPAKWRRRYGLKRYGFHGLSHAYVARCVAEPAGGSRRVVSCHLGAGASLCAILDGRSVDTTMGFTPLEGLVMATRSGSVDPGLLLWLMEQAGISPGELANALEHESGLLGLGGDADMQAVLAAEAAGSADAALAVGVYLHRLRAGIAAMVAALGTLDVLVFTGGVGEHSAAIRDRAVEGLGFLGGARTLVIPAREDLQIAREVRHALDG